MGILLKKKRQREREREQYATMSGEKRSEINKKRRELYAIKMHQKSLQRCYK